MSKINCWEYFKCGREAGGSKTKELGICPAATETRLNGINNGTNGGRACWALAQTLCGGDVQGNLVDKMARCLECTFRKQIIHEEKDQFKSSRDILEKLKD